ncbi:F-box/RNI-like superfamily protein [Striga asiatica]|uniref:F-box/RNI-like superfamily protein n=1 Tax=Striga asiatica TaxID=4170 RepID=A0A5A7QBJ3_STRAF|nr:F-box/RNI-like superfamily protein [Striga asiatica]
MVVPLQTGNPHPYRLSFEFLRFNLTSSSTSFVASSAVMSSLSLLPIRIWSMKRGACIVETRDVATTDLDGDEVFPGLWIRWRLLIGGLDKNLEQYYSQPLRETPSQERTYYLRNFQETTFGLCSLQPVTPSSRRRRRLDCAPPHTSFFPLSSIYVGPFAAFDSTVHCRCVASPVSRLVSVTVTSRRLRSHRVVLHLHPSNHHRLLRCRIASVSRLASLPSSTISSVRCRIAFPSSITAASPHIQPPLRRLVSDHRCVSSAPSAAVTPFLHPSSHRPVKWKKNAAVLRQK